MGNNKFPKAKEVKLFYNENNTALEVKRWKGLVNEDKVDQLFYIVGAGYKVAQHDEVHDVVEKALGEMGMEHKIVTQLMNDGARLRVGIHFPTVKLGIEGENLHMLSYFDNSYDCTTGLRYELCAYQSGDYLVYIGGNYSKYYHRHTKNLNVSEIENSIYKGVDVFQTKIKNEIESLVDTKIDTLVFSGWINSMINKPEGEKSIIPIKYLEIIKAKFEEVRGSLKNLWNIYNLICKTLGAEELHVDRRQALCLTMLHAMRKEFCK